MIFRSRVLRGECPHRRLFFCHTYLLSNFWTSRGHRCFPVSTSRFLPYIFFRANGSAIPLLVDFLSSDIGRRLPLELRQYRLYQCQQGDVNLSVRENYVYLRSPCRLGTACFEACPSRVVASGWGVFLAGVRPYSPSRSGTFLLLRVTARLCRARRVGAYVVR